MGRANPIGAVWAGAMMLDHLGETAAAARVMAAVESVLAEGTVEDRRPGRVVQHGGARKRAGEGGRVRILAVHELTAAMSAPMRNAVIDFGQMTTSVVAIETDVIRDGRRVVGYGFNSNGRYAQAGLLRSGSSRGCWPRRPRSCSTTPARSTRRGVAGADARTRSRAGTASARSPSACSTWRSGTSPRRSPSSRSSALLAERLAAAPPPRRWRCTPPAATTPRQGRWRRCAPRCSGYLDPATPRSR